MNHMHAVTLLIHPNFSSKLMVTCLDVFENSILIRFRTVRNLAFDPVRSSQPNFRGEISNLTQSRDHEVFKISLLIHLHLFELDQKRDFELFESGSKLSFR